MEHFGLRALPRTWPPLKAPKDFEQAMTRLFLSLPPLPYKYLQKTLPGGGGWMWDVSRGMGMSEWTSRVLVYSEKGPSNFKAHVMIPHPNDLGPSRTAISPWWGGEGVGIEFYTPTAMVLSGVIEARVVGSSWVFKLSANGETVVTVTVDPQKEEEVWVARDVMLNWAHDSLAPNRRDEVREELDHEASTFPTGILALGWVVLMAGLLLYFAADGQYWDVPVTLGYASLMVSIIAAYFQRRITTNYYVMLTVALVTSTPLAVLLFLAEAIL